MAEGTPSRPAKKTAGKAAKSGTADETAPAKKAAKAPAKKAPRKAPSASSRGTTASPDGAAPPKAGRIAILAARQLRDLTGKTVEGVIALEKSEDGWKVEVEVLELRRVPDTTDILAAYEVSVDTDGDLVSYQRMHRYVRGTPGEE
jgi:hypothetical protein